MPRFASDRARAITIVVLTAGLFALRVFIDEPGPLYLIPVVLAGLWFGPWAGIGWGAICTGLYVLGREINPPMEEVGMAAAAAGRLVAYCAAGAAVGYLSRERRQLRSRLHAQQSELAELRTLQEALTPSKPPERPRLELATCYLPAERGVAGDFYVVAPGNDGATMLALGDVAGRGLEAAKRVWYVRTLLASSAAYLEDPSAILDRANTALMAEAAPSPMFITAACVIYRPKERAVEWALAGHDPPLRLDDGTPLGDIESSGLPMGIEESLGCSNSGVTLGRGEGVLLYTDGVTEARSRMRSNGAGLFGQRRLQEAIAELSGKSAEDVVDGVRNAVKGFSDGNLADDVCMLALRASRKPDTTEVC